MQAYSNKKDIRRIINYDDFLESKCELIILIDDNKYIDIYTKDKELIEIFNITAKENGFKNIECITKENDKYKDFQLI